MQITEKLRNAIATSLPEIGTQECKRIAKECHVSTDTVYRQWRKIKNSETVFVNAVTLALGELAARKKKEATVNHKRLLAIEKQMS